MEPHRNLGDGNIDTGRSATLNPLFFRVYPLREPGAEKRLQILRYDPSAAMPHLPASFMRKTADNHGFRRFELPVFHGKHRCEARQNKKSSTRRGGFRSKWLLFW